MYRMTSCLVTAPFCFWTCGRISPGFLAEKRTVLKTTYSKKKKTIWSQFSTLSQECEFWIFSKKCGSEWSDLVKLFDEQEYRKASCLPVSCFCFVSKFRNFVISTASNLFVSPAPFRTWLFQDSGRQIWVRFLKAVFLELSSSFC